jgi:hypothetical protein
MTKRPVRRARIDLRTRRAEDRKLFSEEIGAPCVFEVELETHAPAEQARADAALLFGALRATAGIGGSKRRGRGECRVRVARPANADENELLEALRTTWLNPGSQVNALRSQAVWAHEFFKADIPAVFGPPALATWKEVNVVVRLLEPLIAGERPLTRNILRGYDFVPGSLLLGALAARALRLAKPPNEAAFLRVFRSGAVQFPDLLPAAERGQSFLPSLPAPRDLYTCGAAPGRSKTGHGVWSVLLAGAAALAPRSCPECGSKLRRLSGFVVDEPQLEFKAALRAETKIEINPEAGRVQKASLYHREALPTGTLLTGTLRVREDVLGDLRACGIDPERDDPVELRLGKRHRQGYGRVRLVSRTSVAPAKPEAASSHDSEAHTRIGEAIHAGAVPIVLTSRLIWRDAFGAYAQTLSPETFNLAGGGKCSVAWSGVGGFWTHIGLPRRPELCLLPGSVLLLSPGGLDSAAREALINRLLAPEPVGDRTGEGFGRFVAAPFPYSWLGNATREGAKPEQTPDALQFKAPASPAVEDRHELVRDYASKLALVEVPKPYDLVRTLSRLVYAHAGEPYTKLERCIEHGSNSLAGVIDNFRANREKAAFVKGDGAAFWEVVKTQLRVATADASIPLRAMRTRALADALADVVARKEGQ